MPSRRPGAANNFCLSVTQFQFSIAPLGLPQRQEKRIPHTHTHKHTLTPGNTSSKWHWALCETQGPSHCPYTTPTAPPPHTHPHPTHTPTPRTPPHTKRTSRSLRAGDYCPKGMKRKERPSTREDPVQCNPGRGDKKTGWRGKPQSC